MKIPLPVVKLALLALGFSLVTPVLADDSVAGGSSSSDFQIGQSSFPRGDSIEITSVTRSDTRMEVKGHYKLVGADQAQLCLYITTPTAEAVPTGRNQIMMISKGSGDFDLIHEHVVPGMPHVTLYTVPEGKPFGGVYFGNGHEAEEEEADLNLGYYNWTVSGSSGAAISQLPAPNRALLEYLGDPVDAGTNLDQRYSVDGLKQAISDAAQAAGITVKKVAVDDSEFPCIVGVICSGSDAIKLKAQFKKMNGYEYNGSIGNDVNSDGSDTCNVFNLTPSHVYPAGAEQRIYHRLWLRQQMFYDKINHSAGR